MAPNPSIKDEETYQALRDEGASEEKAARIANAQASDRQDPGHKGGKRPPYEEWRVGELRQRARELGVEGRSKMDKAGLIAALRNG